MTRKRAGKWILALACTQALLGVIGAQEPTTPALRLQKEFFSRRGGSAALAWSADGRWLASGGLCGDVSVFEYPSLRLHARFRVPRVAHRFSYFPVHELSRIRSLRFAPDGERLAVLGQGHLSLWSVRRDHGDGFLLGRHRAAETFDWSADGRELVVAVDGLATRLDPNALETRCRIHLGGFNHTPSIAISADRATLAVVRATSTRIDRFRLRDGARLSSLKSSIDRRFTRRLRYRADGALTVEKHPRRKRTVAAHPDGSTLARASDDRIEILEHDRVVQTFLPRHREWVEQAVCTGDGRYVATSSRHRVRLFDARTAAPLPRGEIAPAALLVPAPATSGLVTWTPPSGLGARLEYWNLGATPAPQRTRTTELKARGWIPGGPARFSADGSLLCRGNWRIPTGSPRSLHASGRGSLVPSTNGKRLLRLEFQRGLGTRIELIEGSNTIVAERQLRSQVVDAAFNPSNQRIAISHTNRVRILDPTLETVREFATDRGFCRWLDDHHLVLATTAGVAVIDTRAEDKTFELPLPGPKYAVEVYNGRRLVLVTASDRAALLSVERR